MTPSDVRVGILSPSAETRDVLRAQLNVLGMAAVEVEVDQYCAAYGDRPTRRFVESRPDIVIVDMQDPPATLQALQVLHAALPETWLFVCSSANDSQLIIDAMRAGAREYLLKPIPPRNLSQAIGRFVADRQRHQQKRDAGKIYCVAAVKGGAGATSLAINLAASVAEVPETRVAILDLNAPLGDAAAYLNLSPKFTLTDALASASRLDTVLLESYMSRAQHLAVLPGPKDFWADTQSSPSDLGSVFDVLIQKYSHVVVDLPSSLEREHLRLAADIASAMVVVLTPELPALWRAQRFLTFLATSGNGDKVQLVLNRSHRSDEVSDREVEKTLGHPIYWKLPNNYGASIEAINSGKPLVTAGDSDLGTSYRNLARQLTGIPGSEKRRGLFRLFSLAPKASDA